LPRNSTAVEVLAMADASGNHSIISCSLNTPGVGSFPGPPPLAFFFCLWPKKKAREVVQEAEAGEAGDKLTGTSHAVFDRKKKARGSCLGS
jgi:hypothetical protein